MGQRARPPCANGSCHTAARVPPRLRLRPPSHCGRPRSQARGDTCPHHRRPEPTRPRLAPELGCATPGRAALTAARVKEGQSRPRGMPRATRPAAGTSLRTAEPTRIRREGRAAGLGETRRHGTFGCFGFAGRAGDAPCTHGGRPALRVLCRREQLGHRAGRSITARVTPCSVTPRQHHTTQCLTACLQCRSWLQGAPRVSPEAPACSFPNGRVATLHPHASHTSETPCPPGQSGARPFPAADPPAAGQAGTSPGCGFASPWQTRCGYPRPGTMLSPAVHPRGMEPEPPGDQSCRQCRQCRQPGPQAPPSGNETRVCTHAHTPTQSPQHGVQSARRGQPPRLPRQHAVQSAPPYELLHQ